MTSGLRIPRALGTGVAALLVLVACRREERRFSIPEATERPLVADDGVGLFAGGAPISGAPLDPSLPGYMETAYAVSEGHTLYMMFNCVGCHAAGGGAIGPPFIDRAWRYGSTPEDIATSIVAGRPEGMPSYRGKLVPRQLYQLVAYVRALGGLVRGDAVPARDDHMHSIPPRNLTNSGWPRMPDQGDSR